MMASVHHLHDLFENHQETSVTGNSRANASMEQHERQVTKIRRTTSRI